MAMASHSGNGAEARRLDHREWVDHTRVFLQPIAAPSILGLFGFAGATFMVAAHMAGWYGGVTTGEYVFPFALTFGGLAQFAAGMWAFRARDGMATAMHGMWGAFWMAYGLLQLLVATHTLALPAGGFTPFGYWFVVLAVITGFGTLAALGENLAITSVLATLTVGSAFAAFWYWTGRSGWQEAAGWVLLASSFLAVYAAGAMMIASSWGRTLLPLGELKKRSNIPGGRPMRPLEYELGEPGVKQGQ